MKTLSFTHPIKIMEALGAIADQRITLTGPTEARVQSSDRTKTYLVEWSPDWHSARSDDNGTYWQKQIGYPIIGAMLLTGHIPCDSSLTHHFAGFEWKKLNDQFKRRYDEVVLNVEERIKGEGGDVSKIRDEIARIEDQLRHLSLKLLNS